MSSKTEISQTNHTPLIGMMSAHTDHAPVQSSILLNQIQLELGRHPHLAPLRDFNHSHLKVLSDQYRGNLSQARVLDIGASIHGYALEAAIALGYHQYVGIDLGITRHWGRASVTIQHGDQQHLLSQMDAHRLWFEDESFDVVLCLSGFEHYLFPEFVLQEMTRVLRKGGTALINYEPIWTCSYGHHLHHFGLGFEQVPPWGHLIYTKPQMAQLLANKPWPEGCSISKGQALDWMYDGREINRRDYGFHRNVLSAISCEQMLWLVPHPDASEVARTHADYAASLLPYSSEELLTRGFSCCFQK
jgi:SAM-dependent methyltransferase